MTVATDGGAFLARAGLVERLVGAVRRGHTAAVLGGPGMGKTTVAKAALERLATPAPPIEIVELQEDEPACAAALAAETERPRLLVGGLALHRVLEPSGSAVRGFPLLPLVRRDMRRWVRAAGLCPSHDEFEQLIGATGGHPCLTAAWIRALQREEAASTIADSVLQQAEPLFVRIDVELAHPELASLYAWLEQDGPAPVGAFRKATRADKAAIDRLVLAGPVSRTLRESAEIRISCGLYERRCRRAVGVTEGDQEGVR